MGFLVVSQAAAALVALGFLMLALVAVIAPHRAASGYGVPITGDDPVARAYAAAAGWRDLAAAVTVLAVLVVGSPRVLGVVVLAMALIPLGDAIVLARHGVRGVTSYAVHAGGFGAVVVVALSLLLAA